MSDNARLDVLRKLKNATIDLLTLVSDILTMEEKRDNDRDTIKEIQRLSKEINATQRRIKELREEESREENDAPDGVRRESQHDVGYS